MCDIDSSEYKLGRTRCGDSIFCWGQRTYIMGIINLSPDSFSGDGYSNLNLALQQAQKFIDDGADIIDVGGESTRPSSKPISVDEESHRVIPYIEKLSSTIRLPISIDTYKVEVARRALDAGASIINDISGLKVQPNVATLAADRKVPLILTSNQRGNTVENIIEFVLDDLSQLIRQSLNAGINWNNIILDPGIGFGKTVLQNLEILRSLEAFQALKRPLLVGTSRKSMIGAVLDLPVEKRLEGTAATVAIAIAKGADIVRVHDVKQMKLVCRMADAIVRGNFIG